MSPVRSKLRFAPYSSAPLKDTVERYPPKDPALLTDFEKRYPVDPCVLTGKKLLI